MFSPPSKDTQSNPDVQKEPCVAVTHTKGRKPLSKAQRREIWKQFFIHSLFAIIYYTILLAADKIFYGQAFARTSLTNWFFWGLVGIPNTLIWARFVEKIEKYSDSTKIPYPSTYYAIFVGSFLGVIGPGIMFLLLAIRLWRVPKLVEVESVPTPKSLKGKAKIPQSPTISEREIKPEPAAGLMLDSAETGEQEETILPVLKEPPSPPLKSDTMDSETGPAYSPEIIDDEPFYEEVAKEIESDAMKPGLWTKAFVQADGEEEKAKVIYIRLRVEQLLKTKQAEIEESKRRENERLKAEEEAKRQEEKRKAEAEEEARREQERRKAKAEEEARCEEERRKAEAKEEARREEARRKKAKETDLAERLVRYKETPASREAKIEAFKREFGHLQSYPAKVTLRRGFWGYSVTDCKLIIGPGDLLFIPAQGSGQDLLFCPSLGDRIQDFETSDSSGIFRTNTDGEDLRIVLDKEDCEALIAYQKTWC